MVFARFAEMQSDPSGVPIAFAPTGSRYLPSIREVQDNVNYCGSFRSTRQ